MIEQLKKLGCKCYVADLPERMQFSMRWGAHDPTCPCYRESLDVVDRAHDERQRNTWKSMTMETSKRIFRAVAPPPQKYAPVEINLLTIIRLPQYGAALVIAVMRGGKQEIFYGPMNADGSVHFNQDEFVVLGPRDISINIEVGGRRN